RPGRGGSGGLGGGGSWSLPSLMVGPGRRSGSPAPLRPANRVSRGPSFKAIAVRSTADRSGQETRSPRRRPDRRLGSPSPLRDSTAPGRRSDKVLSGVTSMHSRINTRHSWRWDLAVLACACLLGALVKAPEARAEIEVGAAVRVITPDPLLPVSGGMGVPKPT